MATDTPIVDEGERLSIEARRQLWERLLALPGFDDLPYKIEITAEGRIVMTPVRYLHGRTAMRIGERLKARLGGEVISEVLVETGEGDFAPDVAWCSAAFDARNRNVDRLTEAPEICVEVASRSNTQEELAGKVRGYLAAGAQEVWVVYPVRKEVRFFNAAGALDASHFAVSLDGLFD